MRRYQAIVLTLLSLLVMHGRIQAAEISIAVAANFTDATRQIVPLFEQATGHTVKLSFGSTGKLYAQIENGAPFEVFLAADSQRPIKAEKAGLAVAGSRFVYAQGRLVLWSSKPGLFSDGEAYLKTAGMPRLAIANPKTAPYGLAAQQVLQHLGAWSQLQPRLVRGDSIAQTFQFVATGNAEAGIVAYSQVKAWHGMSGSEWVIPRDYYAPINQAAVLLKKGATNPAAKAFLDFLKGNAARKVIKGYGYGVQ
jgi:molybdate transport system substrate-binding protein